MKMATFLRTALRARCLLSVSRQSRQFVQPACWISTSKKNKDGINATIDDVNSREEELKQLEEHFANQDPNAEKNWVSYGGDLIDRDYDKFLLNMIWFTGLTLTVVMVFFFRYSPDHRLRTWAMREAFLELHRREELGLPLIDRNMADPSELTLPSEEELEGVRIHL